MTAPLLSRSTYPAGDSTHTPPVRIVHLGLGHFFRAHQAWYTAHATDAAAWGIAAFSGRSTGGVDVLAAQDGLYTLVERDAGEDRAEVVASIVEARPGSDVVRLSELLADPVVAVVTLTITESGYRLLPDGRPDLSDALLAGDLSTLRAGRTEGLQTAIGRLLAGLAARRLAGAGAIAVVPCDNIPGNGAFLATGLTALADLVDPSLAAWIRHHVSFVSTSVDRITPHVEMDVAPLTGRRDEMPVVTEPFADWVLSGAFPAGRPLWESAGARFVDDIEPWEHRKLWLLNGAHSILAFAGLGRGFETVAETFDDPACRALVDGFWDEAVRCLPEGTEHIRYREQLVERFSNPRIEHRLTQIAAEATVKAQFRFAAVAERTLAAGRTPDASLRALAVWIAWVLAGDRAVDARAAEVASAAASDDPVRALLALISPALAADDVVVDGVRAAASLRPALAERTP